MHIFGMVTNGQSNHFTILAIESFLKTTRLERNDLFYLIDDDSEFSLPAHLNFAQLRILRNERPASLARNLNRVISKALEYSAHAVLLKNDTVFTEGWFEALQTSTPTITAPLTNFELQYKNEQITIDEAYTLDAFKKHAHYIPELVAKHRESKLGLHTALMVPFIACRVPNEILRQVGFLDENYGKGGGEDFDYCMRAQLEGYSVAYAGDSYLLHFGGKAKWNKLIARKEHIRHLNDSLERFTTKWGTPLADIVMRKDPRFVTRNPGLRRAVTEQAQKEIVLALVQGAYDVQPEPEYASPSDILISENSPQEAQDDIYSNPAWGLSTNQMLALQS
jgi:GT2 family glycosyltransferase